MDAPDGTFIMYSAAAGETALDRLPGNDPIPNSVYSRALLPLIRSSKVPLPDLAQELRRKVREIARSVDHVQRPAYYDGLVGRFCLGGCEDGASGVVDIVGLPDDASKAWSWIKGTDSPDALITYLKKFGDSDFAKVAKRRLDLLGLKDSVLHVVSVGVSQYADPKLRLQFPAKDAQEFAKAAHKFLGPHTGRFVLTRSLIKQPLKPRFFELSSR